MRKIYCVLALAALMSALPAKAQFGHQGGYAGDCYFGVRVGLNVSMVNSGVPRLDGDNPKAGLALGGVVGFQLVDDTPLYVETGLLYTEKGGKSHYDGGSFTYSLNYLELPLVVKYGIEINTFRGDLEIQPFFGGFLAQGLTGKIKEYNSRTSTSSFSNEAFRRFDGGLRMGCGVQFNHLYGELGYELGLANISHDEFDTAHTSNFFLTVGVNF